MKLGIPKIFKSLNELFDRFKFQLYVLCIWKNIQIYKRNKVRLCIDILWPLLFVGIVVLMRYNYGDRAYLRQDECHFYSKPLLSAGFFEFLHGYICHFNNTCHQEYVENDNFFANQTSQLSAAFLEINKFMEEDKKATGDILIRFLKQLSQYDSLKNDNKQTDKTYLRMESKKAEDKFSMGDFIKLHQYFINILQLPKVRRVLRHFRPLLNQFKDWISAKPTLYEDDIIAIIGGMKLICGPKFYLDNEHLEKINVETLFKEMLVKPFRTKYRDMKNEFCQILDKNIKDIPMLNKIWITIKPLFMGKLLFTPRNAATWKIMQNINSTFERFAFYHKFTKDFINFLYLTFQKINNIEGEKAFAEHKIDILGFNRHLEMAYKLTSKISEALDCLNVDRIEGFSTESELVDHARHHIDQNTFFAGVVFLDMEDNNDGTMDNLTTLLNFVRYKIRMDSQKIEPTDSILGDDEHSPRRHPLTHLKYYYHGFVVLQELLDTAITDISSNNSLLSESYIHKPGVTLQQFPHPCYNRDEFLRSFYWILPLQICLSWSFTIAVIILNMAEESRNNLHQYYRILGMNDTILILAQLATLLIPIFISSALTALILFQGKILLYSDTLAIVLILFNYALTTVCFGILIGTFLRKYSVSPYFGILIYLMLTLLPYYIKKTQSSLVLVQRIFLWLIPPVPFMESFFNIIDLEIAQVGLQWDNIVFQQKKTYMSFIDYFIILIFDAILFIGTSIMIEKAKINFYWGTYSKKLQNIKQIFFRRIKKQKDEAISLKKFIQNELHMEKEHVSSKCSIEIIDLTKETLDGKLLDNVSLKFYENQVICLLTDNSTTGNALTSMIMKVQYPDLGSIHIYDNNQIKNANRKIGFMPKYNIAIEQLTVEENLWFYTKLKDSEKNINMKDIEKIMKTAYLFDVRYTQANQLSPNLIRRLCVAIAFVGQGEIVLLHNPFSGQDFYSKHVLCDMLAEYKLGRSIIFTTNDVNDAGIVSDKIAVINDGRLLCYGSKTFLRTTFTKGFELKVEIDNIEDIISLCRQLKFVNLPKNFETDIKNGFETDNHITNIFLQIMRHFITDSYFVGKLGQAYIFILPYNMKDGIYDCTSNTLTLRKLFCLLDRCKSQWNTLKYQFNTLSTSEVYENIRSDVSNISNMSNTFRQEENNFSKQFYKTEVDINQNATRDMTDVNYSILSPDSLSKHFVSYRQFSSIHITRFKRNYRNIKYALKLLLAPFLVLFFILIWVRSIPTPQTIYPVPLINLLYPNDMEIFVGGILDDKNNVLEETNVGDLTLRTFIESPLTLYIKNLGHKCVYLIYPTNTDFSGCNADDPACHISAIFNISELSIGRDNKNIYKTIFEKICKVRMTGILEHSLPKALFIRDLLSQSKCICENKDGEASCPNEYHQITSMSSGTPYVIKNIDSIPNLPAFLTLEASNKFINGFEALIKNKSYNALKMEQKYVIQKLLSKALQNISLPVSLIAYSNQMHILKYLTHFPYEMLKIWFNNRLRIGMPSFLSTYDTAYFRRVVTLKDISHHYSPKFEAINKNITKLHHYRSTYFDNNEQTVEYNDIYGGNDYGMITINHPISSSLKAYENIYTIVYLYTIIFTQICVTSYITTMILWDYEERHTYIHQYQLHKIYSLFLMFTDSMYNFGLYIIAVNTYLMVFRIKIGFFRHLNHFYSVVLYVLYGWTLIPFTLAVAYLIPKWSLVDLNIINILIGLLCLLLEFIITINEITNQIFIKLLINIIPHYGFEKLLFILIGESLKQYEDKFPNTSKISWEYMVQELYIFILSGIFYYTIVCCYKFKMFLKGKQILNKYIKKCLLKFLNLKAIQSQKQQEERCCSQGNVLRLKLYENIEDRKIIQLERNEVRMSDPSYYPILVKNVITNKLNNLNIKVETGSCLGLIRFDLGMTSFIKLLTGEDIQFQGDIYILGHNTKLSEFKIPDFIGYAPKDIYLDIYLTPRESLEFYAYHKYKLTATCKKAVTFLIDHFDIKENRWIIHCLESTKRKLVIAIALMLNLPILILDEPFKDLCMKDISIVEKTILDITALGKCVIVVLNSIKVCKNVCSKLVIFDDKNIKCVGTLQDLESRYLGAYNVSIEFNRLRQKKFTNNTNNLLAQRLIGTFPSSIILKHYMSYIEIYIFCPNLQISRIFNTLEAVRDLYDICDYSIRLASFEEILSSYSNSLSYFSEDMITHKRLCNIPYASDSSY